MSLQKFQIDNILANLSTVLSSPDGKGVSTIAQAVIDGDMTMDDLLNTGQLTPAWRQQVEAEVSQLKLLHAEDNLWLAAVAQNTIAAFQNYLDEYSEGNLKGNPKGKYIAQANTMIMGLRAEIIASQKFQYIEDLKHNINAYPTQILNSQGITYKDLINAGIEIPDTIEKIWNDDGIDLQLGEQPDEIPSGRTEIYFWGAPGSGKTCTLAAILSTAKKEGYFEPQQGKGLMYMTQLSSLFVDDVATLPKPSPIEITQGLSFDLRDENLANHPVTLIEISGEIFECFSHAITRQDIPNDGHLASYNNLLNFLKATDNPKFHFFVIDVDNKKRDKYGFTQMDYLQNAALFFQANNIFNEKTAGIYILVTKSDLLSKNKAERTGAAIDKLKLNYINLINSLKAIAYQHKLINKPTDMLQVIPFTIGDVYLQNKCVFDPVMSKEVIKILQQNVAKAYIKRKSSWLNL